MIKEMLIIFLGLVILSESINWLFYRFFSIMMS